MVAMSYFCRQKLSQISLEIVANCSHPSEILAFKTALPLVVVDRCTAAARLVYSSFMQEARATTVLRS